MRTFRAVLYSSFFTAFYNTISAPILGTASHTGDLPVRNDLIPVADFHPQLSRMMQFIAGFFIRVCCISRAGGTIIPARCYYFTHYSHLVFLLPNGCYYFMVFPLTQAVSDKCRSANASRTEMSEPMLTSLMKCAPMTILEKHTRTANTAAAAYSTIFRFLRKL